MKYTISALVENHSGVLSKISGLFSRRGFNIDSLTVGPTFDPTISRITIVADADDHTIEQIEKQLNKLINVIKVKTFATGDYLERELLIVKVSVNPDKRNELMTIAEITGAQIMDLTLSTMTMVLCEKSENIKRFEEVVTPYGIMEMVRTGTVAIEKGSEVFSPKK